MPQRIDPTRLRDVIDLAVAARRVTTDSHLAAVASIDKATLSRLLSGERDGTPAIHGQLADALGVHVRTITTRSEVPETDRTHRRARRSPATRSESEVERAAS